MRSDAETGLIRQLCRMFDNRVYCAARDRVVLADLMESVCPAGVPRDVFLQAIHRALNGLPPEGGASSFDLRAPGLVYQVRLVSDHDGLLVTCALVSQVIAGEEPGGGLSELSPRELQVLELLVAGLSNKQVAAALFLSPRTIEKHRANIHRKTGTCSLAVLTRLWMESRQSAEAGA